MSHAPADIAEFSELVELIYTGATDIRAWDEIPRQISRWLQSSTCLVFTPQYSMGEGGFTAKHQLQLLDVYESRFREQNIWEASAFRKGLLTAGTVMRDQELVSDEEFTRSSFYQDLLAKIDIGRLLAGVILTPDDNNGKLVVIAAHNPLSRPFSEAQAEKLHLLMPHLSRSLGIFLKLRAAEIGSANKLSALDAVPDGLMLFDGNLNINYANKAALRILRQGRALRINQVPGARTLVARDPRLQEKINKAISAATSLSQYGGQHYAEPIVITRGPEGSAITLNVSSLARQHELTGEREACAIALICASDGPADMDSQVLEEAYGLTQAEIRVAHLLVEGDSLKTIASLLGITENTVRSHVKNIYQKTNARSRAKLVRLLLMIR